MRSLDPTQPKRILVRGTNWVGDAVMNLPTLGALHQACPQAEIDVLARPWVAAIYQGLPFVSQVRLLEVDGRHRHPWGRLRVAAELRPDGYDWAVLLQNAIEAAIIARWAGIPVRIGFNSDCRGFLLTHSVKRAKHMRRAHETSYYLWMLRAAGLLASDPPTGGVRPVLGVTPEDAAWAEGFLAEQGLDAGRRLVGMAPGAAFGPAKCWPAERYAWTADLLHNQGTGAVLLFGSRSERTAVRAVQAQVRRARVIDLAGKTGLGQALALLARLDLLITNDSGLMHAAAALGTPTLAVFGSTNPLATGPLGRAVRIVHHPVECGPCKKPLCPTDLRCLTAIAADEVAQAGLELMEEAGR